jgi:hypothetical protein
MSTSTTNTMIPTIKQESFALEPTVVGKSLVVRFTGNGDMSAIKTLEGFLKQVESEMVRMELEEAVVDLRDLYFMNSSCIKAFVSWIYGVRTGSTPYSIRFLANPHQHWQANSLRTMQRLAPALVKIDNAEK